jgi:hypothetical protein
MNPITQTIIDDHGTIIYIVLYAGDGSISDTLSNIRSIAEMISWETISAVQCSLYSLKN